MNVICIEEKAFYTLLDGVIKYVKSEMEPVTHDKWMDKKEAMQVLRIKSATTLQKLRDEGKIPKGNTSFTTEIPLTIILRPMSKSLLMITNFFLLQLKFKIFGYTLSNYISLNDKP